MTAPLDSGARCLRAALLLVWALASCGAGEVGSAEPAPALTAGGRASFAPYAHVCARAAQGAQCWGAANAGQLGDGWLARRSPVPVAVKGLPAAPEVLVAGGSHTCAAVDGRAWCWGENTRGQGGGPRPLFLAAPTPVADVSEPVTDLGAGVEHTCAVGAGDVWCWGRNASGEAGRPPRSGCEESGRGAACIAPPAMVEGLPGNAESLALGEAHSCALVRGQVWCWGAVARGRLGAPESSGSAPRHLSALPAPVTRIAAGSHHTCAIAGGDVWCWGAGERGQLGSGAADRATPVRVEGVGTAVAIDAGGHQTCASAAAGVVCWGSAGEGPAFGPTRRVEGPVASLAVGVDVVCVAAEDGTVRCLGDNAFGQLGNGDAPRDRDVPARVVPWDDGRLRDRNGDGRVRVACVGDSNTAPEPGLEKWCERLGALLPAPFEFVNRGLGGATATPGVSMLEGAGPLRHALESDRPDALILALGSNDVILGVETERIVGALLVHARQAYESGVVAFVALSPPLFGEQASRGDALRALNEALRARIAPDRLVDFATGFERGDYSDAIHLGPSGQARRAERAASVLRRAAGREEAP